MTPTFCLLWALLASFFNEKTWSFKFHGLSSNRFRNQQQQQQQHPISYRSFDLGFMSAVTDLPLQSINNLSIATDTKLSFKIKEAKLQDLAAIVSLRVNVFFPELKTHESFHTRILNKMRSRWDQGSVNLVALRSNPDEFTDETDKESQFMGNLIGAIEFSPSDFQNTVMENVGASRKIYVADLCIRQDARRIGVATSLLQYVELFALRNQYREIYLHVEVENAVARSLYIKNGYLEVVGCDWAREFTMERLHKPPDSYVMLWKSLGGYDNHDIGDGGGEGHTEPTPPSLQELGSFNG